MHVPHKPPALLTAVFPRDAEHRYCIAQPPTTHTHPYPPQTHLSASLMVLSLCAMVSTVQALKACLRVACSTPSAAWSTLLVASSSTRMRLERSSARAWGWGAGGVYGRNGLGGGEQEGMMLEMRVGSSSSLVGVLLCNKTPPAGRRA
jgi:hypothetical protein